MFQLCLSDTSGTSVFLPICTKGGTENLESLAFCKATDRMQHGRAKDYFYLECELYKVIWKELYEEHTNRPQRSQFFSELIFKKHISRTEDGYSLCWFFFYYSYLM